jgi:CubicO group peptidase (beta-lactamase class C family)
MKRILFVVALILSARVAGGQELSPDVRARIDRAADEALAATGAPSASIAVVLNGQISYVYAYGKAQLESGKAATPEMRYSIGSVSKQFTATAILMLAEQGRLSLDDSVGKYVDGLTRGNEVTIRQILSMTSGYQDYWPQDYVMPPMLQPTTPADIVKAWAGKPLDFEPGTRWQYSNTNYVIAGMIVEKLAGKPLVDFLGERVFRPLKMLSVTNIDESPLGGDDPSRYLRYALGPPRVAPKEGKGWLSAAGELAMTARDLATWDIAMIDQALLKPASYRAMQTDTLLKSGVATSYGLGVHVGLSQGRRVVSHTGEVSGFTTDNQVFPDDRAAVVVFANMDATPATGQIAGRIAAAIFTAADRETEQATEQAKKIFGELQHGRIDRSLFSANANAYFSEQALTDFAASLGPLGSPESFVASPTGLRGGMVARNYRIRAGGKSLSLTTFILPDGRLEQYQIAAGDARQ